MSDRVECPKGCGAPVVKVVRPAGTAFFEDRKIDDRPWRHRAAQDFKAAVWYSDADPRVEYRGPHRCAGKRGSTP